jgi:hypothetical protein
MLVSQVLVQVAGQTHSVAAVVLVTSLKHSLAEEADVNKQGHRVGKTLKLRLALISWQSCLVHRSQLM